MSPPTATSGARPKKLAPLAAKVHRYPRAKWPLLVVVVRADEQAIMTRADLAAHFRTADLEPTARECMSRKVAPGHVLVWLELDVEGLGTSGFYVVRVGQ